MKDIITGTAKKSVITKASSDPLSKAYQGFEMLVKSYTDYLCTRQKCSKSQRSWTRRQITY